VGTPAVRMPGGVTLGGHTLAAHTPAVAILGMALRGLALDGTAAIIPARAVPIVLGTPPIGMAETGTGALRVVAIGAAATTGTAVVIGEITMANGVGGTVTDGVIRGPTWCSSAILGFPGGGVGAGAHGQAAGDIPTDIMATAIPITAATVVIPTMDTAVGMVMEADTALNTNPSTETNPGTEVAANPESQSYSAGCHALVITTDPWTESLGHRRAGQFRHTSRTTAT
jgi:hypothetical protein